MLGFLSPAANAAHPIGVPATRHPPTDPGIDLTGQGRDGSELAAQLVDAVIETTPIQQARAALPAIVGAAVGRMRNDYALSMYMGAFDREMTDDEIAVLLPLLLVQLESGARHPDADVASHYAAKIADLRVRAAAGAAGSKARP